MSKQAVFTMKLEPELRERFMAEVANEDRPASQVMRELMRGYIEQRRQAREYDDYLRHKVDAARTQRDAGLYFSNEEVERSEEHTSELQSRGHLVCRLLLEKKTAQVAAIVGTATNGRPSRMARALAVHSSAPPPT